MKNLTKQITHTILFMIVSLFLVSCGGASSGPGTTAPVIDPDAPLWGEIRWGDDWG